MNFNSRLGLFVLLASLSSAALGAVIDVKVKHSKETCMIGGCYTDPAAAGCANHFLGGPDCDAYYCRYPDYDTKSNLKMITGHKLRVWRGPTYDEYVQDTTGLGKVYVRQTEATGMLPHANNGGAVDEKKLLSGGPYGEDEVAIHSVSRLAHYDLLGAL
ncbi:hypothetical protein F5880DRAFT_1503308 [Lentinula raphanica]|nr:hypothetical protein F5880DRAFT_1503308 [Lentinula raphanica]